MKKLLLTLLLAGAACFAQTNISSYTISAGAGYNSYQAPAAFTYGAVAVNTGMGGVFSLTTVEFTRSAANIRSGFGKDLATQGRATLFVLGDAGVATNSNNTGLDLSGGGGIRVRITPNSGTVATILINKSAITNPNGTNGVSPTFTGGYYFSF